ncbi:TetR/AcrR family transcriptional regulator [Butyrivibrio sp. M55]|uniref:TetR/AcrR family transcriptional regulator n=1 Tax=Butyrivibrio sp. M55 TaxID=1855323 RepID=UPI0008F33975|nr:TetR/AcrR family transcriptional regulator [Butyrivibrio sp. M55]SFU64756.1 transcriptional regulator, TetR family [Butyrivibrio sp. M55]
MNERFFELKKDKQERIINAAFKVFAENGYTHSSTDEIVKTAEISKGLLFHYFGNKIGLYSFLYDYATRSVTLELSTHVEKSETGYFELYKQVLTAKGDALKRFPYIFAFLKRADEEPDSKASSEISEKREKFSMIMRALKERADITVFSTGVDYNKIWYILDYTVEGVLEKNIRGGSFRADLFMEEASEYVDMVQKMVLT